MKKLMILGVALVLMSMTKGDGVITKENGVYIINTTTLAKNVRGYRGTTPLKIYVKKNKIINIILDKVQSLFTVKCTHA